MRTVIFDITNATLNAWQPVISTTINVVGMGVRMMPARTDPVPTGANAHAESRHHQSAERTPMQKPTA